MKHFKKIFAVILACCMCCIRLPVHAYKEAPWDDINCGDNLTWSYDGEEYVTYDTENVLTISGTGPMWDYDTSVAPWYKICYSTTRIEFEDTVESIGDYAFNDFTNLRSVSLPKNLKTIGDHAFEYCMYLQEAQFPDGLVSIGDNAFMKTNLKTVALPDSVRSIGDSAFCDLRWLSAVELSDGLTSIGDYCFSECPTLAQIRIPDTVTDIGEGILDGDAAWFRLQTDPFVILGDSYLYRYTGTDPDVIIPDNITRISSRCFTEPVYETPPEWVGLPETVTYTMRTDLKSVTLPDSLTVIPDMLLCGSNGIESVHFGADITELPASVCSGCISLHQVDLPDHLQKISDQAFMNSTALQTINIPETVTEIGADAFKGTAWLHEAGDFPIAGDHLLLRYQGDAKIIRIPDGVKTICTDAFRNCNVVSVTCPSSLRNLCTNSISTTTLVDLTFSDGISVLPEYAVSVSNSFSYISIPESVTEIAPQAIYGNRSFTVVGKSHTAAETYAFGNGLQFRETVPVTSGRNYTLDPETDFLSFSNSLTAFGNDYTLTERDAALLEELGVEYETEWGGSCYGMCVAVILAKCGLFSAKMFSSDAACIHDLSPTKEFKSMINYYFFTQTISLFANYPLSEPATVSIYRMITTAESVSHGAPPFLLCFEKKSGNMHAVVGYGIETGTWSYYDRIWTNRILCYDPNTSRYDPERFVYYDPETFDLCIPHYDIQYSANVSPSSCRFFVCNDLQILNAYPYPFDPVHTSGDVNADGELTADDAAILQSWLLTSGTITDWTAADFDQNHSLSAKDLTLLKHTLIRTQNTT